MQLQRIEDSNLQPPRHPQGALYRGALTGLRTDSLKEE